MSALKFLPTLVNDRIVFSQTFEAPAQLYVQAELHLLKVENVEDLFAQIQSHVIVVHKTKYLY